VFMLVYVKFRPYEQMLEWHKKLTEYNHSSLFCPNINNDEK
jgi:hypothetical protein